MNGLLNILAANTNYINEIRRAIRSSGSSGMTIITTITVIVLAWVGIYFWEKYRKRGGRTGRPADDLFFDLCKSHSLNRYDCKCLIKAATAWGLTFPESMFVDPKLLTGMAATGASYSADCDRLRKKLFDPQDLTLSK